MKRAIRLAGAAFLIGAWCTAALGNGGPFVVKDPHGDPAAKGVFARLDPTLKPAQETRLRVVKEDLTVCFVPEPAKWQSEKFKMPPVAEVTAAYQIENPTDEVVAMDFGFPILRGIYVRSGMVPYADVEVRLDKEAIYPTVISNSSIYGVIRQNGARRLRKASRPTRSWPGWRPPCARPGPSLSHQSHPNRRRRTGRTIWTSRLRSSTRRRATLSRDDCRENLPPIFRVLRENLRTYLTSSPDWTPRDAALMVEYVGMDPGQGSFSSRPNDHWEPVFYWPRGELMELATTCLGPLSAIGEQKATQLFARLASRFDRSAGTAYEAIFRAWGGDVRERSIDLATGRIRPRELALGPPVATMRGKEPPPEYYDQRLTADPTVYARIDYLDPDARITKEERSCYGSARFSSLTQQSPTTTTQQGGLTGDLGIGGQQGFEITSASASAATTNPWEIIARNICARYRL